MQTQAQFKNTYMYRVVEVFDFNGQSLAYKPYDNNIEGSPFLLNEFTNAKFIFFNNKEASYPNTNLNIERNEVCVMNKDKQMLIVNSGLIHKIYFNYTDSSNIKLYKCGYPAIENQTTNYYYEVLAEGKLELVKRNYKLIASAYDESNYLRKKEFVSYERLYIYSSGEFKEIKLKKEIIVDLTKDKSKEVDAFMIQHNLNLKKLADVILLLNYYNSLP
jgi:hypothetical protein